jgi:hypothetical protein
MEKDVSAIFLFFLIVIIVSVAGCTLSSSDNSQTSVTTIPTLQRTYVTQSTPFPYPTETIQTYSYPNSSGVNPNANLKQNYMEYSPIYQNTFSLIDDSTQAIKVQVTTGPMLVNLGFNPLIYSVDKYYPDVCYAVVTIRELPSGTIVAQEGWGRNYTNDYSKQLIAYGSGPYHIDIQGREMNVTLTIYSGDSPKLQ